MTERLWITTLLLAALVGCGTTKWTSTSRSATEQLLISDAMDRAVSRLDFRALAGKTVYLDAKPLQGATDAAYLTSSLRQHMLSSGCILKDKIEEADYVVEARSGAVGTDLNELVYGVPRVDVPAVIPVAGVGVPPSIPEIKLVTRTDQRAVVKIAVFAYNRKTGRPVWQSGVVPEESTAKAIWVFGAGPFQRGSIFGGTSFAGDQFKIPLIDLGEADGGAGSVSVADEAYFVEPKTSVVQQGGDRPGEASAAALSTGAEPGPGAAASVIQTGHAQPAEKAAAGSAAPAAAPPPPAETAPAAPKPAENPPSLPAPQPPTANPVPAAPPAGTPATAPP